MKIKATYVDGKLKLDIPNYKENAVFSVNEKSDGEIIFKNMTKSEMVSLLKDLTEISKSMK
jgi:hypothetical protein